MALLLSTVFFFLVFAPTVVQGGLCRDKIPETVVQKKFGGKCYAFFVDNDKDYAGAEYECIQYGGTLATAKTRAINSFLADSLKDQAITWSWIGLSQPPRLYGDPMFWSDGSLLGADSDFNAFPAGQRNRKAMSFGRGAGSNLERACVVLDLLGAWHNFRCTAMYNFGFHVANERDYICEFSARTTSATTKTPKTTETTETTKAMTTTSPASKKCKELTHCDLDCKYGLVFDPLSRCVICMCNMMDGGDDGGFDPEDNPWDGGFDGGIDG